MGSVQCQVDAGDRSRNPAQDPNAGASRLQAPPNGIPAQDMRLTDILTEDRVRVAWHRDGIKTMPETLDAIARMLATATSKNAEDIRKHARNAYRVNAKVTETPKNAEDIRKVLIDREHLQSTGIGDGVAIPHGAMDMVEAQTAAVLLCPDGIDFHSIDDRPVQIVVGVLGPRRATGEHLRMLARISRLLRDGSVRRSLLESVDGAAAFAVIQRAEEDRL